MKRPRLPVLSLLMLVVLGWVTTAVPATTTRAAGFEMVDGNTPGGARCRLAVPGSWNGRLLIIAHGYIPAGKPLYAGFDPGDPVYGPLLEEGWIVAATSYRRNGFLFREAAADVEELRQFVAKRQGREPGSVLVEGTSLGGFIVALLAEHPPHPSYVGGLALGAAMQIEQPGVEVPTLTGQPCFRVLYLSNRDEVAGPWAYMQRCPDTGFHPGVWTVARDGHVNLNRQEVGAALSALRRWVDGTAPMDLYRDATLTPAPAPQTVTFTAPDDRSAIGKVLAVDPAYGNLTVDFRPADLARLGLKKGETAVLRVGETGPEVNVLLGTTFGDVKEGEWVCFPTADGYTLVCRNFADAAGSTGTTVGSAVTVRKP